MELSARQPATREALLALALAVLAGGLVAGGRAGRQRASMLLLLRPFPNLC